MMKKLTYRITVATVAATICIAGGAAAGSQQERRGMPPSGNQSQGNMPRHPQGMADMMDMSAMRQEPHHVLAMAYQESMMNFAKALRQHAAEAKRINPEFARAAVGEMKRSFDQMQQHHRDHMKTMDQTMKAHMADMMKQMDAHHAAMREHLAALEKEVHTSAPDATSLSRHLDEILKLGNGMANMHGGGMEHRMAGPDDHKMN